MLSDTHSYMDEAVLKHVQWADEVWHAGDIGNLSVTEAISNLKPLKAVYGNIDGTEARALFPLHQRFFCEALEVWITHIGGYPGKYHAEVREELKKNPPNLFICGHSHILKVQYDTKNNFLFMNPGAAGKSGFHQVRTLLRFVVEGQEIKDLHVIELKK